VSKNLPKNFFVPKIFQVVIDERDSLCTTLAVRENRIAELNVEIAGLNKNITDENLKFNQLEQQYNELMNTNLSQSEQYTLALKQKSDELSAKEKLLFDRESSLRELQKVIAHQDSVTKRLNSILRDALLGFKSDELSVEIKMEKFMFRCRINYSLNRVVQLLKQKEWRRSGFWPMC